MSNDKKQETQFPVRCSIELRETAEALAKSSGWSLVEWVRRAMQEKIDREMGLGDSEPISLQSRVDALEKIVSDLRVSSGVIHGLSIASDLPKFEKVKSPAQRRY